VATKKRKNLEKLNECLANWIVSKLASLKGLPETGPEPGPGKRERKKPGERPHNPPVILSIHRDRLEICRGVSYQLRAVAYDSGKLPVPPGKLVWKSNNPAVVSVSPEGGMIQAKSLGLAMITVTSDKGLISNSAIIQVHEATKVEINAASPVRVGSNRRYQLATTVKTGAGKTVKNAIVSWRSSDEHVVTVGQDGWLVGGEVGEAEVVAHVGPIESDLLEVIVEKGGAGKPKGGGRGRPRILLSGLSGQHVCPFDGMPVILQPTDPPVYQRPYKPDYDSNVFWINLQHPLANELLTRGEESVQWRTYHFQRLVDVYTILHVRTQFAESENLDVDKVLDEIHIVSAELYTSAKDELFNILYDESIDLSALPVA
jgi:hypothetical protein